MRMRMGRSGWISGAWRTPPVAWLQRASVAHAHTQIGERGCSVVLTSPVHFPLVSGSPDRDGWQCISGALPRSDGESRAAAKETSARIRAVCRSLVEKASVQERRGGEGGNEAAGTERNGARLQHCIGWDQWVCDARLHRVDSPRRLKAARRLLSQRCACNKPTRGKSRAHHHLCLVMST